MCKIRYLLFYLFLHSGSCFTIDFFITSILFYISFNNLQWKTSSYILYVVCWNFQIKQMCQVRFINKAEKELNNQWSIDVIIIFNLITKAIPTSLTTLGSEKMSLSEHLFIYYRMKKNILLAEYTPAWICFWLYMLMSENYIDCICSLKIYLWLSIILIESTTD